MQKAADIAVNAINALRKSIKEGLTEIEIANFLAMQMLNQGASKNSFDLIVAIGKNSAIPHHRPDNTKVSKSQFIIVDIGCIYQGYCSDITRTL